MTSALGLQFGEVGRGDLDDRQFGFRVTRTHAWQIQGRQIPLRGTLGHTLRWLRRRAWQIAAAHLPGAA